MRSAGVHGQVLPIRADGTQAADPTAGTGCWRRWTRLLSRSQNHPLPHISEAEWKGPVRGALLISSQELSPWKLWKSLKASQPVSSSCPEVLDLDFSIWDKYTSSDTALAVPGKGWFLLTGYTDLDESFSHSLRSISTGSSFTGEDSEGKTKPWSARTLSLWDI